MTVDFKQLEAIADEVMAAFDVVSPPVPIETMLQQPKASMWEKLDVNQLSGSFLSIREYYSPRMSLARLLARHVASSPWGRERGLFSILKSDDAVRAFARMLIMPQDMVLALSGAARNPTAMSMHFEVPEDDARQRLQDLAGRF
jgi:hypothetical protein